VATVVDSRRAASLDSYFPWKKWTKHVIRHLEVKTKKKTYTFAIVMDSQQHCLHTRAQGKKKGHKMFHFHGQLSWRDKTQENYPDEIYLGAKSWNK